MHPTRRRTLVALMLVTSLLQMPVLSVFAQDPAPQSAEEKKLRDQDEKAKKKEEDRKEKEAKARAKEQKKYNTLKDFAEDQYASDLEFKDAVDETYLDLQGQHAIEAYVINTRPQREYLATENEGEVLKIRRALYENPRVAEYVNRLGQRLVPDDTDKLYTFKVMVSPIPTAYTLSTGTILVSTGMISMLDNEAQLAYILGHELAHVHKDHWRLKVMMPLAEAEYNERQEKKARWRGMLIGAVAGAAIGGIAGGKGDAAQMAMYGANMGQDIARSFAKKINVDWHQTQEDEADDFALKLMLDKSYDAQEVPRLYENLAKVARSDARMQLGFLGNRARIRQRTEYSQRQLQGALSGKYQELVKSGKLVGTSPEYSLIMAELKRDNGIEAFYFDMFRMSLANLQQSYTIRSDDPLAAYYYARVLKQVGRTKEDLDQAQQLIMTAIRLDARGNIPEIQLHRAMLLVDSKEPALQAEAVSSLKQYILAYQKKRIEMRGEDGTLPSNVDILYDYMRLLGEKNWRAPQAGRPIMAGNPTPAPSSAPAPAKPVPASGQRVRQ